jgi:PTH2 family peptidyl-tRNA hydrolase
MIIMECKQVIVMRKDLKMRRGKEIAQGAHASMKWLVERVRFTHELVYDFAFSEAEKAWMEGLFTKICCQVESEDALRQVSYQAEAAGVKCYLITDSGATEFAGVPTVTCLAIGPDTSERIDPITRNLKLY